MLLPIIIIIITERKDLGGVMSMWLILTDILSRTVSELSQLIVQILDTLSFWATLWRLRDNVRCSS